jgi:hypothetical protein
VFFIARKLLSFGLSLFLSAAVIVGPTSMYAAHFMPDSMFFAFATGFIWLVLRVTAGDFGLRGSVILGVAIGVVSLVKPHGLFLLAVIPVLVLCAQGSLRTRIRGALLSTAASSAVALAFKLGIGFVVAGENGTALFRRAYGEFVPAVQGQAQEQDTGAIESLVSLSGHFQDLILSVTILFLVPILATVMAGRGRSNTGLNQLQILSVSLLALLGVFVAVVAVFAFQLGAVDPTQELRVQLRYFEFLTFLIPIPAIAYLKTQHRQSSLLGALLSVSIAGLSLFWWFRYLADYIHVYSDATVLPMLVRFFEIGTPIALLSFALAILWGINRDWAIKGWAFGLFPIILVASIPAMYFDSSIRSESKPDHVVAAEFAAGSLNDAELNKLVVVGSNRQQVEASRFIIGNPNVGKRVVNQLSEFNIDSLPPRISWVLILGDQSDSSSALQLFEGRGFQLIARDQGNSTFFDLNNPGMAVLEFLGFEQRDSRGAWTQGQLAVVVLMEPPLPGKSIEVSFLATPDLEGKTVVFSLGEEEIEVPIERSGEATEIVLNFQNESGFRDLAVFVPESEPLPGAISGLRFLFLQVK